MMDRVFAKFMRKLKHLGFIFLDKIRSTSPMWDVENVELEVCSQAGQTG